MKNPAFQLRSSWAQFVSRVRIVRAVKSATYVISIRMNISTPPASILTLKNQYVTDNPSGSFSPAFAGYMPSEQYNGIKKHCPPKGTI
jgi:hypothetical protein